MGYILKFRLKNLHTIIIVTKVKKGFLKKRTGERFLYFYDYAIIHLITVRKSPMNDVVVG